MCLLIVNHTLTGVTQDHFHNAWNANPDGFGMAFRNHKGKLTVYKNLESWKAAYADYTRLRSTHAGPFLLHFRQATHGLVDRQNCHPFRISRDVVFAHNGIVNLEPDDPTVSDTWALCEVLKGFPIGFLQNPSILTILGLAIGHSKLAFLDTQDRVTIVNEHLGHWQGKNWFSNVSYCTPERTVTFFRPWRYTKTDRLTARTDAPVLVDRCGICNRLTDDYDDDEDGPICRECQTLDGAMWSRGRR